MTLSPQQRDELRRLLADELRAAWQQAAAEELLPVGPATEAEDRLRAVEERRRLMRTAAAAARTSATGRHAEAAALEATETDEPG
jgi:hypothetical protein